MTNHAPDPPPTDGSPDHRPTDAPNVRLRPQRPPDVLDLVPILLGFHPSDSLVMVVLQESSVALTARIDLGSREELEGLAGAGGRAEWLGLRMAEIAAQHAATGVVLVGYADDPTVAALALHRAVLAQPEEVEVVDAICADRERWWSLFCPCSACADAGTPYRPGGGRLAAEAVYAGVPLQVFGDRQQKEATVRPPAEADRPALQAACEAAAADLAGQPTEQWCAEMTHWVDTFRTGTELADEECARLAVLVGSLEARDTAWAQFTRSDAERMCDLWGQVVRRTVAPYEPAPLCLLGLAGWLAGDGALQVMCFERALAVDPGYSLARLLEQLNERAVPPSLWDEMADEVRALSGAGQS